MPEIDISALPEEITGKYSIVNNSFVQVAKADLKDKIEVEVGDTKQPDFYPQVKIKRWDNEVNCSVRLVHTEANPEIKSQDGKIVWQGSKIDARFYSKPKEQSSLPSPIKLRFIRDVDNNARMAAFPELHGKIKPTEVILYSKRFTHPVVDFTGFTTIADWTSVNENIYNYELKRFFTPNKDIVGGFVLNEGVIWQSIIYPYGDGERYKQAIRDSVIELCKSYGIDAFNKPDSNDLFFTFDGKEKKFMGDMTVCRQGDWESSLLGLSFTFPVDIARDIYNLDSLKFTKKGEVLDIADVAGGLHEVNPNIDIGIFQKQMAELTAQKLGLSFIEEDFSAEENTALNELALIHNSSNWILNASRPDALERIYDGIPDDDEDLDDEGGYEFDVVLKERPLSNILSFTINTKGVDYFYQQKLVLEKCLNGILPCSKSVLGSYAIYASENKINYVGGKEYKCGKVGHIYRPKIIDSNGDWVWGELLIENGLLNVEVPQEFLDNALYPVIVDPTFGYTGVGAFNSSLTSDAIHGGLYTGAVGTGNSISWYVGTKTGTGGNYKCGLYEASYNYFSTTDAQTGTSVGWETKNFTSPPTISAVDYWIVVFVDSSKSNYSTIRIDDGISGNTSLYKVTTYPTWPDPIPSPSISPDRRFSIYCTYTAGGGGLTKDLSDTVTLSESIARQSGLVPADIITLSDALAKVIGTLKADTITLSDEITVLKAIILALSDTTALSDSLGRAVGLNKADSINLSDVIARNAGLSKADTITLSDVFAKVFGTSKTDSITLSDAAEKAIKPVKADSLTLSDAATKVIGMSRSDTATLSDAIAKTLMVTKSDTIALSDSITAIIILILSLSDTVTLSDSATKRPGVNKADTVTLSDVLAKTIGILKADTITLSDSLTAIITLILALSDTVTLSDSAKRSTGMSRADTVTLSDTAAKKPLIARADTVTLSDVIAKAMELSRADTATLSDAIAKAARLSLNDLATLTDALTKSIGLSEADIITLADVIIYTKGALRLDLSDTITLSDLIEVIKLALEFVDTAAARQFLDTIPSRNFTDQAPARQYVD